MTEETQEKTEKIPFFRDSKGRPWAPRITGLTIKKLEQKTGRGLFGAVFATLKKSRESVEEGSMEMIESIFGSVWHLLYLIYEGSRDENGLIIDDSGEEVTFDDFCQSIEKPQFSLALHVALEALFGYFPKQDQVGVEDPEKKVNPEK